MWEDRLGYVGQGRQMAFYKTVPFVRYVARGGAVGRGTALQPGKSRVRYPIVSLEFFIDIVLPYDRSKTTGKCGMF